MNITKNFEHHIQYISTHLVKYPSLETVPIKWKRADALPDAGGVVHAGQVEGGVLVAPVEGLNAPCHRIKNIVDCSTM